MPRGRSASPARTPSGGSGGRASGSGGNDRGLVIHRVVKEAGGSANYPLLTKMNYNDWSLLVKIKLQARCLWGAIDPGSVELHEDRMALDAICSAVPPEMISTLATKKSAKEAWESIKKLRIGDDRIRKSSAQKLRREYETMEFRDGESVDFAMRLTGVVNHLATLGDPEDDRKVVEKLRIEGSVVRIEGCGTVLLACKNGEHRVLANVYYIPRLKANIISLGQLDESHYQVLIEDGVLRIRDEKQRLLLKVPEMQVACTSSTSTSRGRCAWLRAGAKTRGVGMLVSGILTLPRCAKWGVKVSYVACRGCRRSSRCARPASLASSDAHRFRCWRKGAPPSLCNSCTATSAAQFRRRHRAASAISCYSSTTVGIKK